MIRGDGGDVRIANERAVLVVVPGREGKDLFDEPGKVLGFARKGDGPVLGVAVVERADADGIARGDVLALLPVVEDESELGIEH